MKKIIVKVLSLVIIGGVFLHACKQQDDIPPPSNMPADVVPPVITLILDDDAHNRVEQWSTTTYTDPGAMAMDAVDGSVIVTVSGTVNMANAGDYTRTYIATDAAGNMQTADRLVTVDGGLYLQGIYTCEDFVDGTSTGVYYEAISSSTTMWNKIHFTKFANYPNAAVYATISGTTITVPTQTVHCGVVPDDVDHTFSGSGTFTNNLPISFQITYTDVSAFGTYNGYDTYVIQ